MNSKSRAIWLALFIACAFTGCRSAHPTESGPSLFLGVTPSLEMPAHRLLEAYRLAYPQAASFQITIQPSGNIADALDHNRISAAVQWDEPSADRWSAMIGWTGILIIVNPRNPLNGISSDQARKIFLGLIDRWETLGGSADDIHRIAYEPVTDIGDLFQRSVLGQNPIVDSAIEVPGPFAMQQEIRKDRYSIGYILGTDLTGDIHPLKIDQATAEYANLVSAKYPYATPIFLLSKNPVPADIMRFAGWAQSVAGQSEFQSMNPWE